MRPIVLLGAGAFAREAYDWIRQSGRPFTGFFAPDATASELRGLPVFRAAAEIPRGSAWLAGVGTPGALESLSREVDIPAAPALVHPTCVVGTNVEVGDGSIVCPLNVLSCDIRIGRGVVLNASGTTGHDVRIGSHCALLGRVSLAGGTTLGERVMMGTGSLTVPGVSIADGTVVGAGAVVTKDLDRGVYAGVPARLLKPAP